MYSDLPFKWISENAKKEESYQKECMSIAYDLNVTLTEKNGSVFIEKDGKIKELCRPTNPKQMWFEAWEVITEMIPLGKTIFDYLK